MRTTIEIKDEHRAKLVELAARRREKGFSRLIEEALEGYLRSQTDEAERRSRAMALKGRLGAKEAAALRTSTKALRRTWR